MSEHNLTKEFDILEVIQDYIEVEGKKAICPFHADDDPSMSINTDLGIFKCFGAGCGVGGNAVKFVSLIEDISYSKAIEKLAKKYNKRHLLREIDQSSDSYLEIKTLNKRVADLYHKFLLKSPKAKKARLFLKKRGISRETVKKLHIGYAPSYSHFLSEFDLDHNLLNQANLTRDDNSSYFKNRIIFPISKGDYIVGFMGRTLSDNPKVPKYLNSQDSDWFHKKDVIYGWDINKSHIRDQAKLIIVEGQFDVAQLVEKGVNIGLAVSGSYFNEQQAYHLSKRVNDVLVFCDGDKAGFQFGLNVGQMFLSQGVNLKIAFKLKKDPDDLLKEKKTFKKAISGITYNYIEFLYTFGKASPPDLLKQAIKRLSTIKDDFVKITQIKELSHFSGVPEQELFPLVNRFQLNPYAFNKKNKEPINPSIEDCLLAALYVGESQGLSIESPSKEIREEVRDLLMNPHKISLDDKRINSEEFIQLITLYSKFSKKEKEKLILELYNQYIIKSLKHKKEQFKKELRMNPDRNILKKLTEIDQLIEELNRGPDN